jgi:hypothetical protein
MATAGDSGRSLLDRPQRLGVMPTWWFWRDRENWRYIRWPFTIFVVALVMGLALVGLPLKAVLPLYLAAYFLALGSVEKYIRHQALKRRALAEREAPDALPEQSQH